MSDESDYCLSRKHWLTAYPNPEEHFAKLVESIARTLHLDTTSVAPPTPAHPVVSEGTTAAPPPPAAPVVVRRPHPPGAKRPTATTDTKAGPTTTKATDRAPIYKSGSKYVGDWCDDKPTGKGVYHWADGERDEGYLFESDFHGQGTKHRTDDTRRSGRWKHDKFVR